MTITRYELGILLPDGKFVGHVVSDGGYDLNDFPPEVAHFADGSTWEDHSAVEGEEAVQKWVLDEGQWTLADPMEIDKNGYFDVSGVNTVVVAVDSPEDGEGEK